MRARRLVGLIALVLCGCSGAVYGPALDRALALCKQEARDAHKRTGEVGDAIDAYERCKLREGAF